MMAKELVTILLRPRALIQFMQEEVIAEMSLVVGCRKENGINKHFSKFASSELLVVDDGFIINSLHLV